MWQRPGGAGAKEDTLERKVLLIGLILVGVALTLFVVEKRRAAQAPAAASAGTVRKAPAPPAIRGKPFPDFELPDLDGGKLRASDLKDKVVLVNFWATWCAPCELEIPWFIEFDKKYREKGFEIVGISLDEGDTGVIKRFVAKKKMNYKVVVGDEKTAEAFGGILGLPTSYMVDRNGKLYSIHRGLVGREIVEAEIRELLGLPEMPKAAEEPSPASLVRPDSEPLPSARLVSFPQ